MSLPRCLISRPLDVANHVSAGYGYFLSFRLLAIGNTRPRPRRNACVSYLLARRRRETSQRRIRNRSYAVTGEEAAGIRIVQITADGSLLRNFCHQIALRYRAAQRFRDE